MNPHVFKDENSLSVIELSCKPYLQDLFLANVSIKIAINLAVFPSLNQQRDIIKILPLLIQPIIENAFKHGLLHQTTVGLLNVKFEHTENNYIQCSIQDNGFGRVSAEKVSNWKPKEY
ncbi:MAG: hypothetical protein AB8G15_19600 [Saprospiraceae bacterium]